MEQVWKYDQIIGLAPGSELPPSPPPNRRLPEPPRKILFSDFVSFSMIKITGLDMMHEAERATKDRGKSILN